MSENIGKYNVILEFLSQTKNSTEVDKLKKSGAGLESVFGRAKAAFAGIIAVESLRQGAKAIFDVTKKYEQYSTILRVALGSQRESDAAMKLIQDTAKETVFSVDELTSSFIKFANRGIKLSKAEIISFADLAASQGKSFDQLTEAILDAQTGEFERLKEFGIRASKSGNEVTVAFKGVNKTIANTPEAIKAVILEMGKLDGVAGSNAAQMKTLAGQVSNLGDNFEAVLKAIGEKSSGIFSSFLGGVSSIVEKVKEWVSIPLSESLQQEQQDLNVLVTRITTANISQETRNRLINELNSNYPTFLTNLDKEKVTNEQLALRLQEANKQYILKIALAKQEEKIKKATEKVAKTEANLAAREVKDLEILIDLNKKYKLGVDFTNKTIEEQRKAVQAGLFRVQKEGVNIGLDNAKAAGTIRQGLLNDLDVESGRKELDAIVAESKLIGDRIRKNLGLNDTDFIATEGTKTAAEIAAEAAAKKAKEAAAKKAKEDEQRRKEETQKTALEQLQAKLKLEEDILTDQIANNAERSLKEATTATIIDLKDQIKKINDEFKNLTERDVSIPIISSEVTSEFDDLLTYISEINKGVDSLFQARKIDQSTYDFIKNVSSFITDPAGSSKQITDSRKKEFDEAINNASKRINPSNSTENKNEKPFFQNLFRLNDEEFDIFKEQTRKAEEELKRVIDSVFAYEQAVNQQRIDLQQTRVDKAKELAEKGKVDQLKIEESRLNELEKKQRAFANAQRSIAAIQIAASSATTIAKSVEAIAAGFAAGGPAGIATGTLTSVALGAQIAAMIIAVKSAFSGIGLKDGTEFVNGPGTSRSDSIFAKLSKGERVVPASVNANLGGFPNSILPNAVALYRMFPVIASSMFAQAKQSQSEYKDIKNSLNNINSTLEGIGFDVSLDADGFNAALSKTKDSITQRKKYIG